MNMRFCFVLLTFLILNSVQALEVDEKLTLRFLKVSNTKKTILINRGAEDGLVVGNHAKFFITAGVIARGVVEKVSPSRSIWSLYRIVEPAEVVDGKVLNLKISSPVKLTEDSTRSFKNEPVSSGTEKMGMNNGELDSSDASSMTDDEQNELDGMGMEEKVKPPKKEKQPKVRNVPIMDEEVSVNIGSSRLGAWEVWGTLFINSVSGTVSSDSNTTGSTAAAASSVDFSLGLEYYFFKFQNFLKDVSVTAFLHKRSVEVGQDIKVSSNWTEFGAGANYHFLNSPTAINKIIGFGGGSFGAGSTTEKASTVTNNVTTEVPLTGSTTFLDIGIGAKYILANGIGARAILDYYNSTETYNYPSGVVVKRSLSGPKIQIGLSYRF